MSWKPRCDAQSFDCGLSMAGLSTPSHAGPSALAFSGDACAMSSSALPGGQTIINVSCNHKRQLHRLVTAFSGEAWAMSSSAASNHAFALAGRNLFVFFFFFFHFQQHSDGWQYETGTSMSVACFKSTTEVSGKAWAV